MAKEHAVGTKLNVKLLRYTPEPEKLVASAAKLCYSATGVDVIEGSLKDEQVDKFLHMLMGLGHESPIEHITFTFGIEGVSRVLTHQLVRHRIGSSYSQQSQRYVKLEQFEYVIPPSIKNNSMAKNMFIEAMEEAQEKYDRLTEILFKGHYDCFIEEGKGERQAKRMAEKKAIEDARYVFPNACETKIVVTMNARALFNFFNHRCCNRAQWEIRMMATEMLRLAREVAPTLFEYAGPNCLRDTCPEGQMTCGKVEKVREKFKNL